MNLGTIIRKIGNKQHDLVLEYAELIKSAHDNGFEIRTRFDIRLSKIINPNDDISVVNHDEYGYVVQQEKDGKLLNLFRLSSIYGIEISGYVLNVIYLNLYKSIKI